jgi:hypothetical protein
LPYEYLEVLWSNKNIRYRSILKKGRLGLTYNRMNQRVKNVPMYQEWLSELSQVDIRIFGIKYNVKRSSFL